MTIISHARKFIFVKTHKTAGTSLEMALSRYCGEHDVVTPFGPEDEEQRRKVGGTEPRNYLRPLSEYPLSKRMRMTLRGRREIKYSEHQPAYRIRKEVGDSVWNSYFKFSVVRNPFDRCISKYFFSLGYFNSLDLAPFWDRSFDQFLRYFADNINENWIMYTFRDQIIVDFLVRYEHLEEDLEVVSRRIGLSRSLYADMQEIRAKSTFRPGRTDPGEMLDQRQRQLVSILCSKEIEACGYDATGRRQAAATA